MYQNISRRLEPSTTHWLSDELLQRVKNDIAAGTLTVISTPTAHLPNQSCDRQIDSTGFA